MSVSGTGTFNLVTPLFSAAWHLWNLAREPFLTRPYFITSWRICLPELATPLEAPCPLGDSPYSLLRPDLTHNDLRWYRNINLLCIDYAFRPRLSPRLTPVDEPAWEPLVFRCIGFSPMFSLLKPTFSLLLRPHVLTLVLHPTTERSPTAHINIIPRFRRHA